MFSGQILQNYVNGQWDSVTTQDYLPVINPATTEVLAQVPLSGAAELHRAATAAATAFLEWRRVPATERVQYLFKLKFLLEENLEDLAQTITQECGKTLAESKGELQRAIENVEIPAGFPSSCRGTTPKILPGVLMRL